VLAEERHQTLSVEAEDVIVAPVDRLVFREALTNILDNAIKYSPVGGAIVIRVARTGDRGLLAVSDQGPGIPPELRARIFDRFFRVDDSRTRDSGGAGLGLAIAKWAVEIHGGEITVEERPGGGVEFRILLPLDSRA
jgi:signal transduction histidine kinase